MGLMTTPTFSPYLIMVLFSGMSLNASLLPLRMGLCATTLSTKPGFGHTPKPYLRSAHQTRLWLHCRGGPFEWRVFPYVFLLCFVLCLIPLQIWCQIMKKIAQDLEPEGNATRHTAVIRRPNCRKFELIAIQIHILLESKTTRKLKTIQIRLRPLEFCATVGLWDCD